MKRTKQRILAGLLIVAMLLAMMPMTLAAATPEIKIGNATVDVSGSNATVVVPIEIINNPGIAGIEFSVEIPSGWSISKIDTRTQQQYGVFYETNEYGEKTLLGQSTPNKDTGKMVWAYGNGTIQNNGTMFWVTYTVPQDTVNGNVNISISDTFITDGTNSSKTDLSSNFTFTSGTVTVTGGIDPNTLKPAITTQPVSATYTYPTTTAEALSVAATAPMDGTLSYQWYQVGTSTDTAISAAQASNFTPELTQYGTQQYYCRITNTVNGGTYTIDTNRVSVTWQRATLPALTLTPTTYAYDGTDKIPSASVDSLTSGTDYDLSGTQTAMAVGGPYTVTATGTGNYTGTSSATWSITPADFAISGSKQMTLYLGGTGTAIDSSVLSMQAVDSTAPTLTYTVTQSENVVSFNTETKTLTPLAVGTATLSVSASAANHNNATETITITVQAKEDVSGQLAFTKQDGTWSYTGSQRPLSTFVNSATFTGEDNAGSISYRLDGQSATLDTTITNAGTYHITAVYDSATEHGEKTLEIVIGKKTISFTPVWDYTNETVPFTYDGGAKTVSVTAESIPDGVTQPVYINNQKSDAGIYDATAFFEVSDKANCQFVIEGTSVTGYLDHCHWQILAQEITFTPSWTGYPTGGFTYDSTAKTLTVTGVPETVQVSYTDNEKTAAGSYTAKASFTAKDTNHTVTQTIDDFGWTINPAKLTLPTAVSGLVFDGTLKTGVPTGNGYTLTGNTGTNAGNYTAKANLKDTANYVWENTETTAEQDIPWTIGKAAAQTLTENISLRYSNTDQQTLNILSKLQKAGTISNVNVNTEDNSSVLAAGTSAQDDTVNFALKTGLSALDAGKTATITVTFDSTNYANSTLTIHVNVIDKNDVTNKIQFESGSGPYTGEQQQHETASITGFNNENLTYRYDGDRTNVGSFTVTAIYDDADNHGEKTVTYTITARSLRITGGTVTERVYDGTFDATVTDVSVSGLVSGESLTEGTDFTITNAQFLDKNASTAAKTVTYQLSLSTTGTARNYTLERTTGSTTGKINKRPITVSLGAIDEQSFTGNALCPQVQLVPSGMVADEQLRNGTDYTVSYTNNRNVGQADVLVIALSGSNYTFTDATGNFNIVKATAPILQPRQQSYSYADFGSKTIAIPTMPTNAGTLSYQVSTSSDVDVQSAAVANGLLSFTLLARDQSAVSSLSTVTVEVSSDNYKDASFTLTVLRTDKDTPTPNANDIETTYTGSALTDAALSGSASFNGTTVSGT